jgi:adenosylcobinamide-phosphate synthase
MPAALVIAWTLDAAFGEPPNAVHPVAWLGRVLGPIGQRLCTWGRLPALIGGTLAWLGIAAALFCMARAAETAIHVSPSALGALLLALALKPCFAWRMLRDEVRAVEHALSQSLDAGRDRVSRLASRDVSAMNPAEIRETAIETLAENLNDSVVAPLFWFAVAGLPGAVVYRFANTADAMWGYRGRYEWAGKFAARADDVLSWLPARLTALLLCPAPRRWHRLRVEAARTPSPNGGWPMGALALRLGVRLRKPGVYALNEQARSPLAADTAIALRVAARAAWLFMLAALVACAGSLA